MSIKAKQLVINWSHFRHLLCFESCPCVSSCVLFSLHIIKIITLLVWRTCFSITIIILKQFISIIKRSTHLLKHYFIVIIAFILRMNIVQGFLMFILQCCRPWILSSIKINRLWKKALGARPLSDFSTDLAVFRVCRPDLFSGFLFILFWRFY